MDSYLFDLHVHTAQTSICGRVDAKEIVSLYLKAGYDGIVITDHYHQSYFSALGDIPWRKKVQRYLAGFYAARDAAKDTGLKVLYGIEFRNNETLDDFLVYGIEEAFFCLNPDIFALPLKTCIECFHEAGAVVIQAHPARVRMGIRIGNAIFQEFGQEVMLAQMKNDRKTLEIPWAERMSLFELPQQLAYQRVCSLREPGLLDGIEMYNGNNQWAQNPVEISEIMKQYPHLIGIAASDFHEREHLGTGGVYLDFLPHTSGELALALGKGHVLGCKMPMSVEVML